ncbi:hypothetical protein F4804DRAFT_10289 [Jackrogersella minutella]|nr:hypothetical protein F4804DRAFT_10289 [Jackrogersella minutella]
MSLLISSRNSSTAATNVFPDSRILWVIISISVIAGIALILAFTFVGYAILRRRRQAAFRAFEAARLRDPTLTWEVYARRRRFTHSRLIVEEELQRSTIIRKSLQSRTCLINKRASRNYSSNGGRDEENQILLQTRRGDENWPYENVYTESEQRLVDENGDMFSVSRRELVEESDSGTRSSPLDIRLETPPPLVHPALRDCARPFPPRSSSLPMDMA